MTCFVPHRAAAGQHESHRWPRPALAAPQDGQLCHSRRPGVVIRRARQPHMSLPRRGLACRGGTSFAAPTRATPARGSRLGYGGERSGARQCRIAHLRPHCVLAAVSAVFLRCLTISRLCSATISLSSLQDSGAALPKSCTGIVRPAERGHCNSDPLRLLRRREQFLRPRVVEQDLERGWRSGWAARRRSMAHTNEFSAQFGQRHTGTARHQRRRDLGRPRPRQRAPSRLLPGCRTQQAFVRQPFGHEQPHGAHQAFLRERAPVSRQASVDRLGHLRPGRARAEPAHDGQPFVKSSRRSATRPARRERASLASAAGSRARGPGLPPMRPRALTAPRPALVRSRISALELGTSPNICSTSTPLGPAVSIRSARLRKCAPRARSASTGSSKWERERASRSMRAATSVSPRRTRASAVANCDRARHACAHPRAADQGRESARLRRQPTSTTYVGSGYTVTTRSVSPKGPARWCRGR